MKEAETRPGENWYENLTEEDCDDNPETGKLVHSNCEKVTWILDKDEDNYYVDGSEKQEYHNWDKSEKFVEGYKKKEDKKEGDCRDDEKKYKFKNLSVSGGDVIYSHFNSNPDMLSGDLTFDDIYDIIDDSDLPDLEKKAAKFSFKVDELYEPYHDNEYYFKSLENFAELTTSNDDLIHEMIDRFRANEGSNQFTSDNLSSTLLNSDDFSTYKQSIENQLKSEVAKIENESDKISNINPGVVSFSDNGALFAWHGTSEITMALNSLTINCDNFSYNVSIEMVDHFGLDNGDLFDEGLTEIITRSLHGMRSWFILQRVRGIKPFKSSVSTTISGSNVSF